MHKLIDFIRSDTRKILNSNLTLSKIQKIYFYSLIIEMIGKNIFRTKRELFYMAVPLFKTQTTVDKLVKNITLDFPMVTNLIKPSLKGLYCGKVDFYYNEVVMSNYNKIDFIPDLTSIDKVKFSDKFG
ncbi:hypothetical protein H312_01085 [Anncaliia algerae PRA339]|uniref:Spo11/DNA topoisomerase VI subunit A N-terminal domain-containing protein n=1 Tax=Anncaliia algerae PRA339 TaxID=1288291 RepID=A0A059F336_9MICR|nr:hypothetical protein H312_01085 [Anncaliia algerae PRA339]